MSLSLVNAASESKSLGSILLGSLKDVAGMVEDITATGRTATRTVRTAAEYLESYSLEWMSQQDAELRARRQTMLVA